MKIILFLNNDIHSATALKLLAGELENHEVKIILSQKVGNVEGLSQELNEMKSCEQFEVAQFFSGFPPGFSLGETHSYKNINSEEALQDFKNFAPDLMLSIRFGQIFKPALIAIPRLGVLNLHSGILPNYRGVMASFWAILNGKKSLGTTLHYINDGSIDTGAVVGFSASEIDWNSSLILNINNLYQAGCELVVQVLQKISAGEEIATVSQKSLGEGRYFSYPAKEDVKKFLELMPLAKDGDTQRILQKIF